MSEQDGRQDVGEQEPLLGEPGDASQRTGKGLQYNLIIGTAVIAQAGIWIMAAIVWSAVFENPLLPFFSPHPLLNSAGVLLAVQAILVVQPTHTASQKRQGTNVHALLNGGAFVLLIAGLIIILYNKISHNGTHFESPHAIIGLTTYILVVLQAIIGFTQYYTPSLYGGVNNAKALYKYHRVSGYVILLLFLATICAAADTGYNKTTLHIKLWTLIVTSVLVLVGVVPRIKVQKLGIKK